MSSPESWSTHHVFTGNYKGTGVGKLLRAHRGLQIPMDNQGHRELHAALNDKFPQKEHDHEYGQLPFGGATVRRGLISHIEELEPMKPITNLETLARTMGALATSAQSPEIAQEAANLEEALIINRDYILLGAYVLDRAS